MPIQFTYIDDIITIPYKLVSSSDSALLTDQNNFISLLPSAENITVTDSLSALFALIDEYDTGSLVENINSILVNGLSDSTSLSETVNNIFIDGLVDAITQDDIVSIITTLSALDADSTIVEFGNFVADSPGSDSGSVDDQLSISAQLSATNDLTALYEGIPSVEASNIDQLNLFEFIGISLVASDLSNLVDNTDAIAVYVESTDSSTLQDSANISADISNEDSISAIDQMNLQAAVVDNDQSNLSEFVAINVSVIEEITLSEFISNSLSSSDSSNLADSIEVSLTSSDVNILSELSSYQALLETNDSANINENDKNLELNTKDIGSLLSDSAFYSSNILTNDFINLIYEQASASVLREAYDLFSVTELTKQIGLVGFQLITLTEKTGIGKAAPLIININGTATVHGTVAGGSITLNINNNSTVHGTVSGSAIILSVSGTEPVLL